MATRSAEPSLVLHFDGVFSWEGTKTVPNFAQGRNDRLIDVDGKEYIDGLSSLYCVNLGYSQSRIIDAVEKQLRTLPYATIWNSYHGGAFELAEKIGDLSPVDSPAVFFTSGGSEAIESAIKIVRQYNYSRGDRERVKFFSRTGAYHGTSMGALSATGIQSIREPFEPLLENFLKLPSIKAERPEAQESLEHACSLADAERRCVEDADPATVAAIIVEPIQNAGGSLRVHPEYFRRLRALCDEYDIVMISDETVCSWGRTGDWFGSMTMGYRPDIITTAKAITSAYVPMGAAIADRRLLLGAEGDGGQFLHGHTFGGHPAAAAAALAMIDIVNDEKILGRVTAEAAVGGRMRRLMESAREWPLVADVRGSGFFFALELGMRDDHGDWQSFTESESRRLYDFLPNRVLDLGVVTRVMNRRGATIQFAPPLTIEEESIELMEARVKQALTEGYELL